MQLYFQNPNPPLNNYVRGITYYTEYNPEHVYEKLLPDGTVNMVFELDELARHTLDNLTLVENKKCTRVWISGLHNKYILYTAKKGSRMLVIQFEADGFYPFSQIPMTELKNLIIDAEFVFGSKILELRSMLFPLSNPNDIFRNTEAWLLQQGRFDPHWEAVVRYALKHLHTRTSPASVQQILNKTGYSRKHFIQVFKKYTGMSPKMVQRISRFNAVLQQIEQQMTISWPQLSLDCGYYDQAHFINEFKAFAGTNPENYLTDKGEYLNFIPLYDKR